MSHNIITILTPFIPLFVSSIIAAHTPGPNNIMLLQSCTIFGYKRSKPHRLGICAGFLTLVGSVNIIFIPLLNMSPLSLIIIKIIGTLYFVWLAYKIIRIDITKISIIEKTENNTESNNSTDTNIDNNTHNNKTPKPLTFWQAFFFQWVNAKAIIYAVSLLGLIPNSDSISSIIIMFLFLVLNTISSVTVWSLLGVGFNKLKQYPTIIKMINILSGLALIGFCVTMWL